MQVLYGEHLCPLDEKNRAVLPQKFRRAIEQEDIEDGFVITQGFDGCLLMFLRKTWRDLVAKVEKIPFTDPRGRIFKRFFISPAREVKVDGVGRLSIADIQRESVGIDREVIFSGMGDHIEIWAPERWKKYKKDNEARYEEVAEALLATFGDPAAPAVPGAAPSVPPRPGEITGFGNI